jgi:hypothetical protein
LPDMFSPSHSKLGISESSMPNLIYTCRIPANPVSDI